MDERQWLECTDPTALLDILRGRMSGRQLQLFVCGCLRQVWDLIEPEGGWEPGKGSRCAVEVTEAYAEGEATAEEWQYAMGSLRGWAPGP